VNHILGGPDYSTANGACVEGDRMIVGLMRMPAGTARRPIRTQRAVDLHSARHVPRHRGGQGGRGQARLAALHPVQRDAFGKATADGDVCSSPSRTPPTACTHKSCIERGLAAAGIIAAASMEPVRVMMSRMLCVVLAVVAGWSGVAAAETWPDRPIKA